MSEPTNCPVCGGPIRVSVSDEGTGCYLPDQGVTLTEANLRRLYADITRIAFDQALLALQKQKDVLEMGGVENGAYWVGLALARFTEAYRAIEADPVQALWVHRLAEDMETIRRASEMGWRPL